MSAQTHTQTNTSEVAALSVARLGASHGYRFDRDVVVLNASFTSPDASDADAGRVWSLRLVATSTAPASAAEVLAAHVISEAPLPPLAELTGAVDNYEVEVGANTPSGKQEFSLTLALVARSATGVELHDFFTYAQRESFLQPRLIGAVGCWFETPTELVLDLDTVVNLRAADTRSGTLAVEVWALNTPYTGGTFTGAPVAGAILGYLAGHDSWKPEAFHLHAAAVPTDARHLVVMLREWNSVAYVTRDHVSFAIPAPAPVLAVPAAVSAPVAAATPVATPAATVKPVAPASAPVAAAAAVAVPKPVAAPIAKPAGTPSVGAFPTTKVDTRISINHATAAALFGVKGINAAFAAEIVKNRPYASLENLTKIKGCGAKSLEKLKPFLRV